jgi:hypothetical protein
MKFLFVLLMLFSGQLFATDSTADPGKLADSYPDASRYSVCPELRGARFHFERARLLCVGCSISPYATEDSIAAERRQSQQRLVEAEAECKRAESRKADMQRRARLPEPRIGMTKTEVIDGTWWGAPERINTTETANLISEQWVYPAGRYLFFRNDRLFSIHRSQ